MTPGKLPLLLLAAVLVAACSPPESSPSAPGASGEAAMPPVSEAQEQVSVTIIATVPQDAGDIYLAANLEPLGPWRADGLLMQAQGRERRATVEIPAGFELEFKLTGGSWEQEGTGPSGTVMPNFRHSAVAGGDNTVRVEIMDFKYPPEQYIADWQGSGVLGTLVYWLDQESAFLDLSRHVEIWLPPGYQDAPERRYPVIYMHDGQNLFDPRIANTGTDWGVDEAMMANVAAQLHAPAIVVGIWNTNARAYELSPWGGGSAYARMIVEELKPRVDAEFRTLTGRENTFTMGSSMGGLVSQHILRLYPEVFSACGCVSTHVPASPKVMIERLGTKVNVDWDDPDKPFLVADAENNLDLPDNIRMYWDWGTLTLDAEYGAIMQRSIRPWLEAQGFVEGKTYAFGEFEGQPHNEAAWRSRLHLQLAWLLAGIDPSTLEQVRDY